MRKSRNTKIYKKGFILFILFIYFIYSPVICGTIRGEGSLIFPHEFEKDFHHGSIQTLPESNVTITSFIRVDSSSSQSGLTVVSCKDCLHSKSKERQYFLEKPESSFMSYDCHGEYKVTYENNVILSLCTYKDVKSTTDALMWINLLHTSLETSSSVLYQVIFWGSYKSHMRKAQKTLKYWRNLLSKIMVLNDRMKVLPLDALQSFSEIPSSENKPEASFLMSKR